MTGMRRMWLDKVPTVVMIVLWVASLLWTSWWTWELWATSDIYMVGPGIMFLVWLVAMLPLFLVTAFRLLMPWRTASWLLGTMLGIAILLSAVPFHLPREHFDANGSRTTVPLSLYGFMTVLTLVPVGSIIAAIVLLRRAGRPDARAERSGL